MAEVQKRIIVDNMDALRNTGDESVIGIMIGNHPIAGLYVHHLYFQGQILPKNLVESGVVLPIDNARKIYTPVRRELAKEIPRELANEIQRERARR